MMDQAELRRRLAPILEAEERNDWYEVDRLSDALNRELAEQDFEAAPEIVNHYLDDADIRQGDDRYGETQRRKVHRFVDTGKYEDSTPIPLWSCALIAVLVIGGLVWLLA